MDTNRDSFIFDSHCHIFPDKIAKKASDATGNYYGLKMGYDGTISKMVETHKEAGISHSLVCSAATTPSQVQIINDFVANSCANNKHFVGFGSLHPDMENADEEVKRMISLGLLGIKLHADFQNFGISDIKAMELYEVVDNRLPILLHMGDKNTNNTTPEKLKEISKAFPRQRFIGAHFGGYSVWKHAAKVLSDVDVMVDTSSSFAFFDRNEAVNLIHTYGAERCFFGSDYPMWSPKDELDYFNSLDLTYDEKRKILFENAASYFNLKI